MQPDDLDQLLARAMQTRPAPRQIAGLAAQARARAEQAEALLRRRQARLNALRRRMQWVNCAAGVLLGLLMLVFFYRLPSAPYSPSGDNAVAMGEQSIEIVDSVSSQIDIELICGMVLLAAVLAVAIEQSMTTATVIQTAQTATTQ